VIELDGLTKRFGSRLAVNGLTLTARAGEIYGFLGANGAGKTTTIRMLCGILRPDAGTAKICGHTVSAGNRAVRCLFGAVGEVQHLYPNLTCRDYLAFFARLYGIRSPSRRADDVLEAVYLADRGKDRAADLSKGLQQKLGLARALLNDPQVLILDEPVSGLDPHGIREVREIILEQKRQGRLVFVSSHVLSEIEKTADRIAVMARGRLLFEGPVEEALKCHASLEEAFIAITAADKATEALP
jgi:ABC-2 type transport system ATP-binding protein